MSLSFTIAAGPRQRSHSQVRDPRNSRSFERSQTWRTRYPYLYSPGTGWPSYTSRLWVPFSLSPTTRKATVEIFDPAYTRETNSESRSYVTTDGQSASLSWNKEHIWGVRPGLYYCQTDAGLLICGAKRYLKGIRLPRNRTVRIRLRDRTERVQHTIRLRVQNKEKSEEDRYCGQTEYPRRRNH
jgi:hypothetical protein